MVMNFEETILGFTIWTRRQEVMRSMIETVQTVRECSICNTGASSPPGRMKYFYYCIDVNLGTLGSELNARSSEVDFDFTRPEE